MVDVSVVIASKRPRSEVLPLHRFDHVESPEHETIVRDDDGVSAARNRGILDARSDKLVFLDDDSDPAERYLREACDLLDEYAIVAGRISDPGSGIIGGIPAHYDQGDEPKSTTTLTGCNMAIRREVFDDVGYFDENLAWGHEETEWSWRALKDGYHIHYSPELQVEHRYAESIVDYWRKKYRFGVSDVYLAKKYDRPLFARKRDLVPLALDRDPRLLVLRSTGKAVTIGARLVTAMLGDVPDPRTTKVS